MGEVMKIFIIEDEAAIREELTHLLLKYGYECDSTDEFQTIGEKVMASGADLILLDINLPYQDGFQVCRDIRKQSNVPIIILTSRNGDFDELMGLNIGADDFISKPYNAQVLLARIQKILSRTYEVQSNAVLIHKGLTLNLLKATILYNGKEKELTKNELGILRMLMINKGNIIPRDAIIDELWQSEEFIDENTLNVNVVRLRKKISRNRTARLFGNKAWLGVLCMKFKDYFIDKIFSVICFIITEILIVGLLWLIEVRTIFIIFSVSIIFVFFTFALLWDFGRRSKYYNQLLKLLNQLDEKTLLLEIIERPYFLDGQIISSILKQNNKYQNDKIAEMQKRYREYRDFLDTWVHEIKTPITSARLIVENEKNPVTLKIDDELRKIDHYVELVLYYAK